MIEKDGVEIQDNFLEEEEFNALKVAVTNRGFDWYFSPAVTYNNEGTSPGLLYHLVHENNMPLSPVYHKHFVSILKQLNPIQLLDTVIVSRIRVNLNLRLPEPYAYEYHSDMGYLEDRVAADWTTSILYVNTNNGYTELETGEIVESVENRLVSFPANIKHRGVTQTDTQTRILVNFNYLKMTEYKERK
jgi:hypothetical protein